ncbi:Na+/H+ antiporter NhaC family protein [Biformimicrobium ophioploci]|uniref:Na+/H+ antiporter NhaC family protein n=1 Tax=Biformimicrobium ophioploci TaxID=3036711 RepID=A0ABQ6LY25_9GAMM|nr:Na+/H+ antiporter NhaC family protein [Microbulbifer sp. NKW57]GMG86985.1 Na+/H+ antiporter NhaC family protein [Microbulbifer sp. NKW57]
MSRVVSLILATLLCLIPLAHAKAEDAAQIDTPMVLLKGVPFEVTVTAALPDESSVFLQLNGQTFESRVTEQVATFSGLTADSDSIIRVTDTAGQQLVAKEVPAIAGWLSVVPAVLAVAMAMLLRNVILALFTALVFGGWLLYGLAPAGLFKSVLDSANVWAVQAVTDIEHMQVIVFCFLIGGMVGIVSKNGGTMGIARWMSGFIRTRKQTQASTSALGIAIFFDDYANSLIVGNTMKKISDTMRISREKLAFLVDSTAAPVSAVLLVTTWVGFQVGLIADGVEKIADYQENAYGIFLNCLAYTFYPMAAIAFVFMVALTGKDFGPMLAAERRAFHTGKTLSPGSSNGEEGSPEERELDPKPGVPLKAINAVVPMLVLIVATIIGMVYTGWYSPDRADDSLREIIGNADAFGSMMWGSTIACLAAFFMTLWQRLMTSEEITSAWFTGARSILLVIFVLSLAWSLSAVNDALHTSDYLILALGEKINPYMMPTLVFLLTAFMAFATGSSWGVWGIMMPMILPLAWAVMAFNGMTADESHMHIFYACVAAVLSGGLFGDHCSPLAESTLLSAMACGCDLIDHVRTQMPYALVIAGASSVLGTIPTGYGLPWWVAYPLVFGALYAVLAYFGKSAEEPWEQPAKAAATKAS